MKNVEIWNHVTIFAFQVNMWCKRLILCHIDLHFLPMNNVILNSIDGLQLENYIGMAIVWHRINIYESTMRSSVDDSSARFCL